MSAALDNRRVMVKNPQEVAIAVSYGLVNAVVCVPVMIGFAHIMFQDPVFLP